MTDHQAESYADPQAAYYAELRTRVSLFEQTGRQALLDDPGTVRLAVHLLPAEPERPGGPHCDAALTLATVLWHQGGTERAAALRLYAWIDILPPALVPPRVRDTSRRLPRLPPAYNRFRQQPELGALFLHGLAALNRYDSLRGRPTLKQGTALISELVADTPEGNAYARTLGMRARSVLGAALQRELDHSPTCAPATRGRSARACASPASHWN
ncbi:MULTISPECIES: hypothetical protein [unclassified Streptomyces]|uniref:hypothetical protein n=1 Tax=unclassified Streptomyces TaxID=2593676 RepID=UPI001BE7ED0F|nr:MULTISPECIES: hypothetical protein [unclassified Streptomyces]MBT2404272.1 hypothetical protein [Streptomyces sp. ISL-21]MBT2454572.1 hypothetical protein [Streptomyces sp. ISL-86]MBT2612949.1 hypothetical protein [Streptomyces sp. ISL-87]